MQNRIYNWIAVCDGKISALGAEKNYREFISRKTELVDLKKKTVIPGLIDAHTHLIQLGIMNLDSVDLSLARSITDIQYKLNKILNERTFRCIIKGHGFDQELLLEKRWPTKSDLDKVSKIHPIIISRVCLHALVANTPALNPIKESLSKNEYKTGILTELSANKLRKSIPTPSENKIKESAIWAFNYAKKVGLTGAHCMVHNEKELNIIKKLDKNKSLPIRLNLIIARELADLLDDDKNKSLSDFLKIGPVKLFVDGSMGARTAALKEPYSDDNATKGELLISTENLKKEIEYLQNSGFQIAFHAIGDFAIETVLTAIEHLYQSNKKAKSYRHRIEHASQMTDQLISKMADLGVLAVVQPQFLISDFWTKKRVGKKRYKYSYPYNSMLKAGIHLSFGSDCPVEKLEPMSVIHSAINREEYSLDECLTVKESIRAFSLESAYAAHSENLVGTIEVGKFADFVVLEEDPYKVQKSEIKNIKVISSYVDGF